METIVTPERTVQRIADRSALEEFVERRNIGWQLAGNLRQLRGFDLVGNDRMTEESRQLLPARGRQISAQQWLAGARWHGGAETEAIPSLRARC